MLTKEEYNHLAYLSSLVSEANSDKEMDIFLDYERSLEKKYDKHIDILIGDYINSISGSH